MRILLVEDERKVASFVARALREQGYVVDVSETGERALVMAGEGAYDTILLDLRLPDRDGVDICRLLRRRGINSPILMLTARGMVENRVEGLDAGADDYLTKPFAVAELLARVRALVRRGLQKSEAILSAADLKLDRHRRRVQRSGTPIPLTSKEFSLLELMLLRSPEIVPRSEILENVWDTHFDCGTNLVEVYINRLRQKIDHDRPLKLIHTVRGVGYRLSADG